MAADVRWFALGLFSFSLRLFSSVSPGFFLTRMFGFLGLLGFSVWLFFWFLVMTNLDNFLGLDYDSRQGLF